MNQSIFNFTFLLLIYSIALNSQVAIDHPIYKSDNANSEFDVAINPKDTNNLVLVSMSNNGEISTLAIYFTLDFGNTWQKSEFNGIDDSVVFVTDPVIEFDHSGIAYIAFLGAKNFISFPDSLNIRYSTKYFKSMDGGKTWKDLEMKVETGDKPWMVIDTFDQSPFLGNIYLSGGDIYCVTLDSLYSFYKTDRLDYERYWIDEYFGLPTIAMSKNGIIYIVYNNYVGKFNGDQTDSLVLIKSYDGAKTFGVPKKDRNLVTYFKTLPRKIIGVSDRLSPKQYLAVDNSGGDFGGRIYLTYTNRENEESFFLDVFLTYSDDEGSTWSEPKPIHTDAPHFTNQFFSSIFVNRKGYLMLDWYDGRNDEFGKSNDFYFGLSKDGGESFKTIKLSSKMSDFTKIGLKNNDFGVGDYHQCVATDRYAFSFWSDGRKNNGDLDIYFAKIDLENIDSIIISRLEDDLTIDKYYPNPVSDKLTVEFSQKKDMKIKWQIFDSNSKLVKQSDFLSFKPIKNKIDVSFRNLPSEIYYLVFLLNNYRMKTVKVIKD